MQLRGKNPWGSMGICPFLFCPKKQHLTHLLGGNLCYSTVYHFNTKLHTFKYINRLYFLMKNTIYQHEKCTQFTLILHKCKNKEKIFSLTFI